MTTRNPWRSILLTGAAGLVLPLTLVAQTPTGSTWEEFAAEPWVEPGAAAPCITPQQKAEVEARIAASRHQWAPPPGAGWTATTAPFAFWPQGGTWEEDLHPTAFMDHEAAGGALLDHMCGTFTYDGHKGSDVALRSFGEQLVGVPVFAAADGVVVATDDGHFDMNTQALGQPANYVILEHAGGLQTWNWHLANGSVAVATGQTVVAGQQIGLTASSGSSNGPHLHLGVFDNGTNVDPFDGPCNPEPGLLVEQPPYPGALWVDDHAFSREDPLLYPMPQEQPRTGQFGFTDTRYEWFFLRHVPENSTFERRYYQPDGTLQHVGSGSFGNPYWTSYKLVFWFNITGMDSIPGTWRVETWINGQVVTDATFEVAPVYDPAFNRMPEPITATLDPAGPTDVLRCRVGGDPLLDDLDYDIVRYRYEWSVDGVGVRDVISAGRSDQLPAVPLGGLVRCKVTPSDGQADGDPVVATVAVQGPAFADLGGGTPGIAGQPLLTMKGPLTPSSMVDLDLVDGAPSALAIIFISFTSSPVPFLGGTLHTFPIDELVVYGTDGAGGIHGSAFFPGAASGQGLWFQVGIQDLSVPLYEASLSNAVKGTVP